MDMILVTEGLDKCVMAVEIEKSSSIACKSGRATCGFKIDESQTPREEHDAS